MRSFNYLVKICDSKNAGIVTIDCDSKVTTNVQRSRSDYVQKSMTLDSFGDACQSWAEIGRAVFGMNYEVPLSQV